MLGIVIEVYAMLVEMMNFLQPGGVALNIFCCSGMGNDEYKQ
jgi:hypothetical protein